MEILKGDKIYIMNQDDWNDCVTSIEIIEDPDYITEFSNRNEGEYGQTWLYDYDEDSLSSFRLSFDCACNLCSTNPEKWEFYNNYYKTIFRCISEKEDFSINKVSGGNLLLSDLKKVYYIRGIENVP